MPGGYIWLGVLCRKQGDAVGRHRERVETRGEYEGYDVGDLRLPDKGNEWFVTVSLSPSATGARKNRRPI